MTARIGNVAIDCVDVAFLRRLVGRLGGPVDDGGIDDFATIGGTDAQRTEPAFYFNQVKEASARRTGSTST